jgi:predicted CXXCH cytochrome family protein
MRWQEKLLVATAITLAGCILAIHTVLAQSSTAYAGEHQTLRFEKNRFQYQGKDGWEDIADVSEYCLGCHDGTNESSARLGQAPPPRHELGASNRNHPVDVPYPDGRTSYRPAGDLDERLVLISGRMTCLTCHSPDADRALVLPRGQSRLCLACHDR